MSMTRLWAELAAIEREVMAEIASERHRARAAASVRCDSSDGRQSSRHKMRRRRRSNGSGYGPGRVAAVFMAGDPCAYCAEPADEWDHIEPRKRGGDHVGNIVRACHSCNHEKSSRPLLLFLALRARRRAAGTYRRLPASRLR